MKLLPLSSLLLVLTTLSVAAVAYVAVPGVGGPPLTRTTTAPAEEDTVATVKAHPASWRLALNLGREFSTPPWDSYGRSGARFPLVVPCDFTPHGLVVPQSDTVSYTAIGGGVTKPIQGGEWKLVDDGRRLECSLYLPEQISKSDVIIPAETKLTLEGFVYSQDSLKQIEEALTKARTEEWKAQEELDAVQVRGRPKQWNEQTQKWEYPKSSTPLSLMLAKQWTVLAKGQERRQIQASKPQKMSARSGPFPWVDSRVFMETNGVIKANNNKVIGRWAAEPIIDFQQRPASRL